ncbi:hypothetical protein FB45DRAFT_1004265 [Roridomyces roridus]|uniref:Zn(2)-C6 fungal-type domain-containing protein n=1 Tax=Roridomyces roridus TaxID=1738132 RepID=A0AAD7FK60_9AGAR|nr:hypothetical protein FB45DRAFT_1004265 [Roridomyces roridus]
MSTSSMKAVKLNDSTPKVTKRARRPQSNIKAQILGRSSSMASPYIPSQFERRTRVYIACVNCRRRKIRCKSGDSEEKPCERCVKKGLRCEYVPVDGRDSNVNESTLNTSFAAHPQMYPSHHGHHREAGPPSVDPRSRYTQPQPQPTGSSSHRRNPVGPGAIHALPSGQGPYPGHTVPSHAPSNPTPPGGAYYHPSSHGPEMNMGPYPTGYEGHHGQQQQLAYPPFQWSAAQPPIVCTWISGGRGPFSGITLTRN